MAAWTEFVPPPDEHNVTYNCEVLSVASCTPPDREFRCSCSVAFGTWEPRELESLLDRPECSYVVDVTAAICLMNTSLEAGRDLTCCKAGDNADDSNVHKSISYREWITHRQPVKLPPGLPRPPRQQQTALCVSWVADGDLEDDCDEWYIRNVANGLFPDWLQQELAQQTQGVQQPALEGAAAAAACPAPAVAAGASCSKNLDVDCRQYFDRKMAADYCSIGRNPPASTSDASCTLPSALREAPAQSADAVCSAQPAEAGNLAASPVRDSPCGHVRLRRVSTIAVGEAADEEEDAISTPNSPTCSDCRTACDDCGSSSRSSSSLSLGSMDTPSEEDEADGESDGDLSLDRCPGCPIFSSGACAADCEDSEGAMLCTLDCTLWEQEVEARLLSSSVRLAPVVLCLGTGEREGPGADCAAWLHAQLHFMLRAVVCEALFAEEAVGTEFC